MPRFDQLFKPSAYLRFIRRIVGENPTGINQRGATFFSPGHYYSPLLDIESIAPDAEGMKYDGEDYWEHVDLRPAEQKAYFSELIADQPNPPFPKTKQDGLHYYTDNIWFSPADAFTLSGILRKEKPGKIIEVGSGFSTAVMPDTFSSTGLSPALTCIEPYPERLQSLLTPAENASLGLIKNFVQEVPLSTFDQLGSGDILFIDSSHVAKVGSDVSHLFLRVLPRLKPGVIVHIHDVVYPYSYPMDWIRQGWAWNESLFLRAFLIGNSNFQMLAFNAYAGHVFPEIFSPNHLCYTNKSCGSIWLRKV